MLKLENEATAVSRLSVDEGLDLHDMQVVDPKPAEAWAGGLCTMRQGDVVGIMLRPDDPRLDQAFIQASTKKLDRTVARGSRAHHTIEGQGATVYHCDNTTVLQRSGTPMKLERAYLVVVGAGGAVLYHHDTPEQRHRPQFLKPGSAGLFWQQQEETPQGRAPVQD